MHTSGWAPGITLEMWEQIAVVAAYNYYHKNKTTTANSLGIAIRTLGAKLVKYEMDQIDKEAQDAARRTEQQFQLNRARGFSPGSGLSTANTVFAQASAKAETGLRSQPIANTAEKQSVSMPVGAEVQEVLSKKASGNHSRKSS